MKCYIFALSFLFVGRTFAVNDGGFDDREPALGVTPELEFSGKYEYRLMGLYKLFDISLYLAENANPEEPLAGQPLSLKFNYNRAFSGEQLTKAGDKALRDESTPEERETYEEALSRLNAAYRDVKKGDSYRLDFDPGTGLSLSLNDEKLVTIEDEGFAQYYLRIWLGQRDECRPIVRNLLGTRN